MVWPDLEATLAAILTADWTQANVDASRTTFINEKDETRRESLGKRDLIIPYFVSSKCEPVYLPCLHVDRVDRGSIEVITIGKGDASGDRTIIQLLCKEVERIVNKNMKSPATLPAGAQYHILRPLQWTRVADYVDFWRYVLEVEAVAYGELRS
jgi:hypothetical protein